jgi:HD-like signal output (HDOD) protein
MNDQEIALEKERIFARLRSVEDLPTMPQVMINIRTISESPKSSAADLANVILKDPALTSRVLRVANSAMYGGFSRQIASVTHAVVLMGFQAVRSVAFGVMVQSMLNRIRNNKDFDFQKFWIQSVKNGVAARMLAVLLGKEVPEEAFVAGFLCDIGQLIFGQYFPEEYRRIEEKLTNWADRSDMEMAIMKVDHQEIGKWMADRWKFPAPLVNAISQHHHPTLRDRSKQPVELADIVYVANWIANQPTDKKEHHQHVEKIKELADIYLNLSAKRIDILLERFPDQVMYTLRGLKVGHEEEAFDFAESAEMVPPTDQTPKPTDGLTAHLNRVLNQMAMLHEVSTALTEVKTASEVYQIGLEGIYRALGLERVILFAINPSNWMLEGVFGFGVRDQEEVRALKFSSDESGGALGKAVSRQRAFNITDLKSSEATELINPMEIKALSTHAFAVIPICAAHRVQGVVLADNPASGKPIAEEEFKGLDLFVKQIELALGRFKDI